MRVRKKSLKGIKKIAEIFLSFLLLFDTLNSRLLFSVGSSLSLSLLFVAITSLDGTFTCAPSKKRRRPPPLLRRRESGVVDDDLFCGVGGGLFEERERRDVFAREEVCALVVVSWRRNITPPRCSGKCPTPRIRMARRPLGNRRDAPEEEEEEPPNKINNNNNSTTKVR